MKQKLRTLFLASSILMSSSVFAAAFQFYELGTPIIGTAGVGQAAVANDASTSYFNPAGMSQLNSTQFMLGSQLILPSTNFGIGRQNTISGDNGGSAAVLTPGVGMYYVYNYSPQLKMGISFTTPYAGQLNYTNGWVGRYIVQSMLFYALDLNPAISYTVNQWLALGAGITLEYANLNQTVALPIIDTIDGQANVKVSNLAPGVNFGILFTPNQNTKIGFAYRSQIVHHLSGTTTFLRIGDTPSTRTSITMPQNFILSLDQVVTPRFNLLGEFGWANWRTMQSSILTIGGYTTNTRLNWTNTYRLGLGGQFKASQKVILQAGAAYDSSPTSSNVRTPNLPMDKQIRVGAGLMYAASKAVKIGLSYEYINLGSAPINNISARGRLQGEYSKNYANVFQASINVDC